MTRADTVTLIAESPEAHGVFDTHTETQREVYCSVRSVGMRESYEAKAIGLNPETVLILPYDFEYQGEKECLFGGTRYDIIRTYAAETDGIELTIQRKDGNSRGTI